MSGDVARRKGRGWPAIGHPVRLRVDVAKRRRLIHPALEGPAKRAVHLKPARSRRATVDAGQEAHVGLAVAVDVAAERERVLRVEVTERSRLIHPALEGPAKRAV